MTPEPDRSGKNGRVPASARDAKTVRRALESDVAAGLPDRNLEEAARTGEANHRAKTEFLAMLSHELRTPLNAINGYTELLAMELPGKVNERQMQYIERIRTSQQHLITLVNDLLQVARPEGGEIVYEPRAVPIRELLTDLEAVIFPQTSARQVELELKHCATDVSAFADAARTQQILINLLSNAVKFTPSGGRITLACAVSDDKVELTVADTGPGIPADKLEAIFEPFVRLGRSLDSAREGVGLGLPISRDLARRMNGEVTAASQVGKGSVFTLVLPRA